MTGRAVETIDYTQRGLLIYNLDAAAVAAFLAPSTWEDRARWIADAAADTLEFEAGLVRQMTTNVKERERLFRNGVGYVRAKVSAILDHLDLIAPSPVDDHALRVFMMSGDPGRIMQARMSGVSGKHQRIGVPAGTGAVGSTEP